MPLLYRRCNATQLIKDKLKIVNLLKTGLLKMCLVLGYGVNVL